MCLSAEAQNYYIDQIRFTSVPYALLTNWNSDFGTDGGTTYFRGYAGPPTNTTAFANPVMAIQGQKISLTAVAFLKTTLANDYDLFGFVGPLSFSKYGILTSTVPEDQPITSATALPAKVDVISDYVSQWQFSGHKSGVTTVYTWNPPTGVNNKVYVLWASPIGTTAGASNFLGTPTIKRVDWAVNLTKGKTTVRAITDAVWTRLANGTGGTEAPFEPPTGKPLLPANQNDWKLLDGAYSGECDEQARLMMRVLGLLGIPATASLMRASLDTTDLFNVETQTINGRTAYLVMDFDTGIGYDWNNFEGVCNSANRWYAVWPNAQADTILDLFRNIPFQQYWVYTKQDGVPGSTLPDGTIAGFESLADPNPVAKP